MKCKHRLKRIQPDPDMLIMPIKQECIDPTQLELQNLYCYVSWLKQRVQQLEEHLNGGEPL